MGGSSGASRQRGVNDECCSESEMLGWREQGRYEGTGAGGQERNEEVECLCICAGKSIEVCLGG